MLKIIQKYRPLRRTYHLWERVIPFTRASFSKQGLISKDGRQLIVGKMRRSFISLCPPLARTLQKHYQMEGGCTHCSSSCNLLFRCPHWDKTSSRCSVYEDRPEICRLFPITPRDIDDRNIAARGRTECGFTFQKQMTQKAFFVELKKKAYERKIARQPLSKADRE